MKQKLKRFMAGFMAMLTLVGTLFTNGTTAFAASPQANIAFWNASVKNSGEVSELKPGYNHGKILYSILDGNSAYCMNFGLRADPDGATGAVFKAGDLVATLTTDKNGEAEVNNLYLGNYYVKEITPSEGYLLDEEEHDVVCDYEGDLVAEVSRSTTSAEQVIKQPFQLIKVSDNGDDTEAGLLAGAEFTAYLKSSLSVKADGSYDFDKAAPVVIGENGATTITSDDKGHAVSIAKIVFVTDGGVICKVISDGKDKPVMIEEDKVNDENQLGFKI